MSRPCMRCARVTPLYLCRYCVQALRAMVPDVQEFTRVAGAKRARVGTTWRGAAPAARSAEQPLPYDPRVTPVVRRVHRAALEALLPHLGARMASDDVHQDFGVLLPSLAGTEEGATAALKWEQAAHALTALMDVPPTQQYVGRCSMECDEELYVEAGDGVQAWVRCPKCEMVSDVSERLDLLRTAADDHLCTVREASRLLRCLYGASASEATLRRQVKKGNLTTVGDRIQFDSQMRPHGSAVYRLGDVMDVVIP